MLSAMMKKFLGKLSIFILPITIYLGVPLYFLFKSGEILPTDYLVNEHQKESLIGLAYTNPIKYIKLQSTLKRSPKILALGTSRVLLFKSLFFNDPGSFYNAGSGITIIKEFRYFIDKIPVSAQPEVLILGMDQYFFNENFDNMAEDSFDGEYADNYSVLFYTFSQCKQIWADLYKKKVPLKLNAEENKIGLAALLQQTGFLQDGSYHYGTYITHPEKSEDYQFKNTFQRIDKGILRFEYASEVNKKALEEFDTLLQVCKKRNIHVIPILPPFAHSVVQKMQSKKEKYQYMANLPARLDSIAGPHGIKVFDFTDLASLGAGDSETVDGFHASEKAYLRMLIKIAENDALLSKYCNINHLKDLLSNAYSDKLIRKSLY